MKLSIIKMQSAKVILPPKNYDEDSTFMKHQCNQDILLLSFLYLKDMESVINNKTTSNLKLK